MRDWKRLLSTKDSSEYEEYLRRLPCYRVKAVIRNKTCMNDNCDRKHHVELRYMNCTSKNCRCCIVQYRSIYCSEMGEWYLEQKSDTRHTYEPYNAEDFIERSADDKRGITADVKNEIDRIISEAGVVKPKRILKDLKKLCKEKNLSDSLIPSCRQINNYKSYLKQKKRSADSNPGLKMSDEMSQEYNTLSDDEEETLSDAQVELHKRRRLNTNDDKLTAQ